MSGMEIIPITLARANDFVEIYHRHNGRVDHRAHRFSLALVKSFEDDGGELAGVAIAGSPISRRLNDGFTLEILRVCVKPGMKNANSMLYARVARVARLMGYKNIVTYTLAKESASSLKAAGFVKEKEVRAERWSRDTRVRRDQAVYYEPKVRWSLRGA